MEDNLAVRHLHHMARLVLGVVDQVGEVLAVETRVLVSVEMSLM